MFVWIAALAQNIRQDRQGAVAIQLALMFGALMGMVALSSEIGYVLYKHRQMQSAADGAAFGAAIAKSTGNPVAFATEADADAAAVGFVNGANGVVITVNNPPSTGPNVASTAAVEVIITQPQTLPLVSAVQSLAGAANSVFNLGVRAVATAGGSTPCALQLSPTANPGVTIGNGAIITLDSCGLQVCSSANTALSMSGGAQINLIDTSGNLSTKQNVSVTGTASLNNGAEINGVATCSSPSCKQSQKACGASANPYLSRTQQTPQGTNLLSSYTTSQTISAGQWTNGVSFSGGATINMNPGTYYVDQGTFSVQGGATLNGTGVTIVLAATGTNYANVNIANGTTITLTAPTTGPTAGIAFFGDPVVSANNNGTETFTGGATLNITGAIYFPQQTVDFSGGVNNPSGCTQLIAGTIVFEGGANFSNNCAGKGTSAIGGGGATTLVE